MSIQNGVRSTALNFFDLPREARDLIYGFALPTVYPVHGQGPRMDYHITYSPDIPVVSKQYLGLFLVNRQMRSESVEIFYEQATVVVTISAVCKNILSISYPSDGLHPIELPSWALRIRHWRVEFFSVRLTKKIRMPSSDSGYKDHFRDTCNFLAQVARIESMTVILRCASKRNVIIGEPTGDTREEDTSHEEESSHEGESFDDPHEEGFDNGDSDPDLEYRTTIPKYASLQLLIRQLRVVRELSIDVDCGAPRCRKLVDEAGQMVWANQPSAAIADMESSFEALKRQLKSVNRHTGWYEPFEKMWKWLELSEFSEYWNETPKSPEHFLVDFRREEGNIKDFLYKQEQPAYHKLKERLGTVEQDISKLQEQHAELAAELAAIKRPSSASFSSSSST